MIEEIFICNCNVHNRTKYCPNCNSQLFHISHVSDRYKSRRISMSAFYCVNCDKVFLRRENNLYEANEKLTEKAFNTMNKRKVMLESTWITPTEDHFKLEEELDKHRESIQVPEDFKEYIKAATRPIRGAVTRSDDKRLRENRSPKYPKHMGFCKK